MKKILVLFIVTLFFSLTCSKKSEPAYSIETIGGIEFVHNSETPLYPEKSVEFIEDLTISSENDKGEILSHILFIQFWQAIIKTKGCTTASTINMS